MRFRALLVVPLAAAAAACGSSSSTPSNSAPAASTSTPSNASVPPGISTRNLSGLGVVLTNQFGRTLYVFTPEKGGKLACTGSCATTWPPLTTSGQEPAIHSATVHAALVGTVANPSGGKIATYAGWPLHTYSGDTAAGSAKGQGIGGQWYAISASGQVNMRSAGASSSSSSSSSSGYGK